MLKRGKKVQMETQVQIYSHFKKLDSKKKKGDSRIIYTTNIYQALNTGNATTDMSAIIPILMELLV